MVKLGLLFNLKIMTQEMPKEERSDGANTEAQEVTPKPLDTKSAYLMVAMGQAKLSRERAEALLLTDKQ